MNQGFGSVTFCLVELDLLDTDPPENTEKLRMSQWEIQQRFLAHEVELKYC